MSYTSETQHKDVAMMPSTPSHQGTSAAPLDTSATSHAGTAATTTSTTSAVTSSSLPLTAIGGTRPTSDRMIIKLTTNLMNTYNAINEKYYSNKRKRLLEQQQAQAAAAAKKGTSSSSSSSSHVGSSTNSSGQLIYNDGHDDKDYNYIVVPHELVANRYVVDHSIGKGSFGRVVKAFDTLSKKYVAIKIVKSKSAFYKQAQIELKILMSLQADADKWNIVNVVDQFLHKNHQCIVFELLSLNLYELLKNTRFTGVSLKLIAKFGQQLLCTLGYLGSRSSSSSSQSANVIHCDLKPENILLRNCFPANDHQILTAQGFVGLDEMIRLCERDGQVSVACYDSMTKSLVYESITHKDIVVQEGQHEIVDMRSTVRKRRHEGESTVEVSATAAHDMYVRDHRAPSRRYMKRTAGELLKSSTSVNMLRCATGGLASSTSQLLTSRFCSHNLPSQHQSIALQLIGYHLIHEDNQITIPSHLNQLSGDHARSVLRGAFHATHSSHPPSCSLHAASFPSSGSFHVASPTLRDQLIQLCIHAGLSATYEYVNASKRWHVRYDSTDECHFNSKSDSFTARTYNGRVWCVSVPHHDALICVRRVNYSKSPSSSQPNLIHSTSAPVIVGNCKKSAIKVIDFGSACFANQKTYTYIQSRFYRAPEVILGLSYNGSIDVWSLGCILFEMHTGKPLFDGQDESDQMVKQVEILGVPPRHMLEGNRKAEKFFEVSESTGMYRLKRKFTPRVGSLRHSLGHKWEDTPLYREFEDLISQMLIYDPAKRIRPSAALAHPFFTAVAGLIAGEGAAAAAASSAASSSSSSSAAKPTHPQTAGSGVATSLATSGDAAMAAAVSPSGSTAMDTSSPHGAVDTSASKFAAMQQAQQIHHAHAVHQHGGAAHGHHHHHALRSRKRPHSNPLFGAVLYDGVQPIQPLDKQVQQAIDKQSAKEKGKGKAVAKQNNLMATDSNSTAATATQSTASSSIETAMDESSQPDASSTVVVPPVTPSKHSMVTRGSAKQQNQNQQPAESKQGDSSASSSGRSTPEGDHLQASSSASHMDTSDPSSSSSSKTSSAKRKSNRKSGGGSGSKKNKQTIEDPDVDSGIGSNAMSRMSLDVVGRRTRSQVQQ